MSRDITESNFSELDDVLSDAQIAETIAELEAIPEARLPADTELLADLHELRRLRTQRQA